MISLDESGIHKTYAFYYYFQGSKRPLKEEALNAPYYDVTSEAVCMIPVENASDFIHEWNTMDKDVDDVYLYLHGKEGCIIFRDPDSYTVGVGGIATYNIENHLMKVNVHGAVYDFSCYGASTKYGKSVAGLLSKRHLPLFMLAM